MTEQTKPAGLEEFDRGWLATLEESPFARLIFGLAGLTRLGERPAELERLAAIIDRSVVETAVLVQGATSARVEGNLIYWDDPFPGNQTRRMLYVGDRPVPMRMGCAPDLFGFAAVLDVPLRVEETCAATGKPIRVDFVPPDGVGRVDPPETVVMMVSVEALRAAFTRLEQVDVAVCANQPFYSSAAAAEEALAANPGSRVFTIAEAMERPGFTYYRDTLRPLIHDSHRS